MKCAFCGRKITDMESVMRGYGPVCYKKMIATYKPLQQAEDEIPDMPGQLSMLDYIKSKDESIEAVRDERCEAPPRNKERRLE